MGGNGRIGIAWSDLPRELLEMIANCLDTETDVLRFRAVCSSWRSSTTPFKKIPCTPLKLPFFSFQAGGTPLVKHQGAYFSLTERTVYRVQLPESKEPSFWLVKIEKSEDGKLRILNPVSDSQIKILPETQLPKLLNTLDFRIYEVRKAYTFRYMNPAKAKKNYDYKRVKKVAVSGDVKNNKYVIMAIADFDKLWYIKSGDEKWTMVRDNCGSNKFLDVVNYKGQFYGIDFWGGTWVFDSMFESTKITYNICCPASKAHLVDLYKGELFLVEEIRVCTGYDIYDGCQSTSPRTPVANMTMEIRVSRIDKGLREWVEAKTVDNQIIFVGDDCSFSVSAEEFEGFKGTRIFYTDRFFYFGTEGKKLHFHDNDDYGYDDNWDYGYNYIECDSDFSSDNDAGTVDNFVPSDEVNLKFRELHGHNTGVCDFASGKSGSLLMYPEYADIFWPPPSWLSRS
ncbi:UNVERIFIED_CONTAM: F-box protein SKIP23 [Sesamum latifolium]|uniref:F-box protein SKIP23 n=1 Tax=Sesamum latifolium TaxID=2727402 RepID=A0AAW2T9D2_9LAMI